MKRNIKLMNLASYCNIIGNCLISIGSLSIIFASINYIHNFNNILKVSKNDLVAKYQIFTPKEFKEIEDQSKQKAQEDLATLFLGTWGKEFTNNPWYSRSIKTMKNIYKDIWKK
jgi:hypothetical protein